MRITSITPMKNEAPFLLEWVAYHRLIGVNDILVFTNDCTDGTDLMLERLDEMGLVRHYANPTAITGSTHHHWQMIRYANALPRLKRSDWVVSFDVDEFLCVNVGDGLLSDLFEARPEVNLWSMSQLNFGHGGVAAYTDDLLTDQFRYAWDAEKQYRPRANTRGTKTLTHQSAGAAAFRNHSPVFEGDTAHVRAANGSGTALEHLNLAKDVKSLVHPHFGYDLVQVNHYVLRSIESYLLKGARGNANHAEAGYDKAYWRRYDWNDRREDGIARWVPLIREARDELLKDAELRALHDAAVAQAQATIAELKTHPEVQELLNRIGRFIRKNPGLVGQDASDSSAA